MKDIIIFGYGYRGVELFNKLENSPKYRVIGFADNSAAKQRMIVNSCEIKSLDDLNVLKNQKDFSVIIAAKKWFIIGEQLENNNIPIEGVYIDGNIVEYNRMIFARLDLSKEIKLYAGDICDEVHMSDPNLYGLSIQKSDSRHIYHDITEKYPLPDGCISSYQAEDVLEHIDIEKVVMVINEIYRILKEGGVFRICLPDYNSPYLKKISMFDKDGNIVFDPSGGGVFNENGVQNGGHLWFPNYEIVKEILEQTLFKNIKFLCYHTPEERLVKENIDFSNGFIKRLPEKNKVDKPIYSIIVDCYK